MSYFVQRATDMSRPSCTNEDGGNYSVSFTHDRRGNRKYATVKERRRFLRAAKSGASAQVYTFCLVLALTGARLSEVLELTPRQIDMEAGIIVIRSLKKRRPHSPVFRAVPVPSSVLQALDAAHAIAAAKRDARYIDARIWPWCRTTAWKRVKETMAAARISGLQASPKGLRHGFAVGALVAGVPAITVMRWLGHARLETTMIYTEAVGAEARTIAKRMWAPLLHPDLAA